MLSSKLTLDGDCRVTVINKKGANIGMLYVFSVFAGRANGARTLVRRKIGWRRGLEISKRGSALPSFRRDKSRAPGEFSVGALNGYARPRAQQRTPATRFGAVLAGLLKK